MNDCHIEGCHHQSISYELIKPLWEAAGIESNDLIEIHIYPTYILFDVIRDREETLENRLDKHYSPFQKIKVMITDKPKS